MNVPARMWVSCPTCAGGGCVNGTGDPQQDRDCPRCKGDGLVPYEPHDHTEPAGCTESELEAA